MNKLFPAPKLPIFVTVAGLLGMLMRIWLLADGIDKEGLLISGHPANILCWVITGVVLIGILAGTHRLLSAAKYEFNFPASIPGGIGTAAAAMGILISSIASILNGPDALSLTLSVLGFISAAALAFLGYCRWKGERCSVLLHGIVCLYLMVYLLCQYRLWSANPQTQDYCFQLLGGVCLLLGVYRRACFDGNMGNRKSYVFFRLLGAYFCMVAIPGSDDPFFYLTGAVWSLTDLCSLVPMPKARG